MKPWFWFTFIMGILLSHHCAGLWAQESMPVEASYSEARALAFEGKRDEARRICQAILKKNPKDVDTRLLFGRLWAWDKEYDLAREQLLRVLEEKPNYEDAREALIDVELWSNHPDQALAYLEEGLRRNPSNENLLYKKATALKQLGNLKESMSLLQEIPPTSPLYEKSQALWKELKLARRKNKFSFDTRYFVFDDIDDWNEFTFEYSRKTKIGTFLGRFNYGYRFNTPSFQIEVDGYPKLTKGIYVYLNFGYSPLKLFPRFRFSVEPYFSLPKSFEISAGVRYLKFEQSQVAIITGSLGKYWGPYWFSLRPYFTPRSNKFSTSVSLSVRRYFRGSADFYVTFNVGGGFASGELITDQDVDRENVITARVDGKVPVKNYFNIKWRTGYERETYPFNRKRNRVELEAGIEVPF